MEQNTIHQQQAIQLLAIPMELQFTTNMKQERIKLKQEQEQRLQQALNQEIMIYL
jgi:uncharacterized protein YdcH (DUF465 family)